MPKTKAEKSAQGLQARRRGIKIEKTVIEYLWPDCPRDEYRSVRDHRELHDKFVLSADGFEHAKDIADEDDIPIVEAIKVLLQMTAKGHWDGENDMPPGWLLEIKADAWVDGSGAMFSRLRAALAQAQENRDKAGLGFTPVGALWLPKHTQKADAIVMLDGECADVDPIMPAAKFKRAYLGR